MAEIPGIGSAAGLAWDQLGGGAARPKTVAEAAQSFEALLIGQMMKISREASSGSGWLGTGDDSSGISVMEFAEQQFAQMLAAGGGMGLGRLVQDGLSRGAPATSRPPSGGHAE
jgi:Rod binding domain-containing protein